MLADPFEQRTAWSLEASHDCVGVEHGNATVLEHLRHGRFAHSDRSRERYPDHAVSNPRSLRAPRSGRSGIPSTVKKSPSIAEKSCTPRASSRNTPTV